MSDSPAPDSTVRRTILPNGVRVLTEEMPALRSACFAVVVLRGSRDEGPQEHGLSHLVEHAAFRGTLPREVRGFVQAARSHCCFVRPDETRVLYYRSAEDFAPSAEWIVPGTSRMR